MLIGAESKTQLAITLEQKLDGSCVITSKTENGGSAKLIDLRQLLQWGLNRVNDEVVFNTVMTILQTPKDISIIK